jgi:DNA-binding transcriptional LysR family regulator
MDLHHLKIFLSVFKHRSFSKASRDLSLTQPTVSDHIQALERELKCKLFDRLGRTILPTKEAEILNLHGAEVVEKAEALKEVIGNLKKEIAGELIVGTSNIPGTYLVPFLMASFREKYPSVSFQISISGSRGIVEKVIRQELLIGIVGAQIKHTQITYLPLMEDELITVASPALIGKPEMTIRDLLHYPIVSREKGSGTLRETERILEERGVPFETFRVAGIFSSTEAVKQAVKAGLGISILSKMSVIDDLEHGTLKEIRIKGVLMRRNIFLITHKKRTLPLTYRAFLEHVLSETKNGSV